MNIIKKINLAKKIILKKPYCPSCRTKAKIFKVKIIEDFHHSISSSYNIELDRPSVANPRKREDVLKNRVTYKTIYKYKCQTCNHSYILDKY